MPQQNHSNKNNSNIINNHSMIGNKHKYYDYVINKYLCCCSSMSPIIPQRFKAQSELKPF